MFKVDLFQVARVMRARADVGGSWEDDAHAICEDLAAQIKEAGGPEGTLEAQLSALLASYKALAEAVEDVPNELEFQQATGGQLPGWMVQAVQVLIRPTIARLRRERDEARALLAQACDYEATAADVRASCSSPANIGIGDPPPKPPPPPPPGAMANPFGWMSNYSLDGLCEALNGAEPGSELRRLIRDEIARRTSTL